MCRRLLPAEHLAHGQERGLAFEADLAEDFGTRNAGEAEDLLGGGVRRPAPNGGRPATNGIAANEEHLAAAEPGLAGEIPDVDGVKLVEADRGDVFGRIALLDHDPPAGEPVAAANPGEDLPDVKRQAERDGQEGHRLAQREEPHAQAQAAPSSDQASKGVGADRGPDDGGGDFGELGRRDAGNGRLHKDEV